MPPESMPWLAGLVLGVFECREFDVTSFIQGNLLHASLFRWSSEMCRFYISPNWLTGFNAPRFEMSRPAMPMGIIVENYEYR